VREAKHALHRLRMDRGGVAEATTIGAIALKNQGQLCWSNNKVMRKF